MQETYIEFYVNENRAIELAMYDSEYKPLTINACLYRLINFDGIEIVAERGAMAVQNRVSTIIDETITKTPGRYHIIWKVVSNQNIYFHKTVFLVKDFT